MKPKDEYIRDSKDTRGIEELTKRPSLKDARNLYDPRDYDPDGLMPRINDLLKEVKKKL